MKWNEKKCGEIVKWNLWQGKTGETWRKIYPTPIRPSEYPHGATEAQTREPSRGRRHRTALRGKDINYFFLNTIIIRVFCARASLSLKTQEPRPQFCSKAGLHRKLRNQGCSFTRDWIGAIASHCFLHTILSLASEQTLKDPKRSEGPHMEVRRVDLANWAFRTSKFTKEVKYQFHQCFWPDQRSGNPNPSPPPSRCKKFYSNLCKLLHIPGIL